MPSSPAYAGANPGDGVGGVVCVRRKNETAMVTKAISATITSSLTRQADPIASAITAFVRPSVVRRLVENHQPGSLGRGSRVELP
jgi:hypothetical protein